MINNRLILVATAALVYSCHTQKTVTDTSSKPTSQKDAQPENSELYDPEFKPDQLNYYTGDQPDYRASSTRVNDIIHTKLEVVPDFKKHYLYGKATLDIKPYYYPVKELVLDAKGFEIQKVQLVANGKYTDLVYKYDSLDIYITLDREYKRTENYTVFIQYTAKPDELTMGGSAAITGDKGLYFINTDSTEKNKPTQFWTQGETEASSCWFPTVDRPNEKMTHEILMTVPDQFKSVSNGLLVSSKKNSDGTRTDHWKMMQPHAPYLVMMACGPFAVVKDTWKKSNGQSMEVSYYVDAEYEQYARDIFGETPRMIEFFSKRMGVEYAWDKYAQVVVHDYVSGAMENTTATIHGDFLHRTRRELLDANNESIIAHELFHHWFGDLVTCESWSNLPLNESFANYSQYLWDEHKYGRDEADYNAQQESNGYFMSTLQQGYRHMIRFDYGDKEEMFDGNSYNKGGRILHMLRTVVGDEAFFESLRVYLTENQFQPAEIHHLRLAFEKVTGRDMNWFFNQWFLAQGHPILEYTQSYENGKLSLRVRQKQDKTQAPLYIIPIEVDIHTASGKRTEKIEISAADSTYIFNVGEEPLCVNPDAQKTVLCEKDDVRPVSQWVYLYYHASNYMDRYEAIKECSPLASEDAQKVLMDALSDKFWYIRELAIKNLKKVAKSKPDAVKQKLMQMAASDEKPAVRSTAVKNLQKYFKDDVSLLAVYEKATTDSSYDVMSEGFLALAKADPKTGLILARKHESEKSSTVREAIAQIYADNGTAEDHDFFKEALQLGSGVDKYSLMLYYGTYLKRMSAEETEKALPLINQVAAGDGGWFVRLSGYQALTSLQTHYEKKAMEAETLAESLRIEGKTMEATNADREVTIARGLASRIEKMLSDLKSKETDKNVLRYIH